MPKMSREKVRRGTALQNLDAMDMRGVNFVVFIAIRLSEGHQYIECISTFSEAVYQRNFKSEKTGASLYRMLGLSPVFRKSPGRKEPFETLSAKKLT